MQQNKMSRRGFLGTAAGVAAFTVVPRHVLGGPGQTPPSEKLNIAGIGVGGQGAADLEALKSQNIVALCDVDWRHAAGTFGATPTPGSTKTSGKCWTKRIRTSTLWSSRRRITATRWPPWRPSNAVSMSTAKNR